MGEMESVSRRGFLKLGTFAAGAAGLGMLAGCAPQGNDAPAAASAESGAEGLAATQGSVEPGAPAFLVKPEPITEFASEDTFDVVVVGAGAAGVSAALKAVQDGAKVAIVQKESEGNSNGFHARGVVTDSPAAEKASIVSFMMRNSDYRAKRELLQAYVDESGEAIAWLRDQMKRVDIDPGDNEFTEIEMDGYTGHFISARPDCLYMGAAPVLCSLAEQDGATAYYSTAGVQLTQDETGRVTGVVGQQADGTYVHVQATKGVILATGDYQGNPEMIAFYCPDVNGFPPLTVGRTGEGHCMGVWAGGRIEPIGHTKMIHDIWMNSAPYLMVGPEGERFADEHVPWWKINTLMRDLMQANADTPQKAAIWSVMDKNYVAQADGWEAFDAEVKGKEVPDNEVTHSADTLEALATDIGADPATLAATVKRYNELVAAGHDDDFGKNPAFLAPIEEGPFYAVQRDFNFGLSATLGGLIVDAACRVLDENDEPIAGLFAVGNTCGPFYGSIDYPMGIGGLSIGRAVTTGYIAGREAAK